MEEKYYVVVVKPTETYDKINVVELESPYLTLDQLHNWTECDTIDIITAHHQDILQEADCLGRILVVLNDNGKLLHEELNAVGSYLYGEFPNDFIVGSIALGTDRKPKVDDEPDIFGMTEEQKDLLLEIIWSADLEEMLRQYA